MRVRFSFAGLSGETSGLGPAQTVSHGHGALKKFQNQHLTFLSGSSSSSKMKCCKD